MFLLDHGFMCNSNQNSLELVGEMRNDYVTASLQSKLTFVQALGLARTEQSWINVWIHLPVTPQRSALCIITRAHTNSHLFRIALFSLRFIGMARMLIICGFRQADMCRVH